MGTNLHPSYRKELMSFEFNININNSAVLWDVVDFLREGLAGGVFSFIAV